MDIFSIAQAAEEAAHASSNPSIAGMFGLNWHLFIAQLVNFAIVLLILWKWVFTPVTKALQKRTQRIEESLRHAEAVEQQKKEFEEWKVGEMQAARKEAGEIIVKAKTDAEKVREEVLAKAKQENEKLLEAGKVALALEKTQVMQSAKGELASLVVLATEKILREKLDEKKDVEMIRKTLEIV